MSYIVAHCLTRRAVAISFRRPDGLVTIGHIYPAAGKRNVGCGAGEMAGQRAKENGMASGKAFEHRSSRRRALTALAALLVLAGAAGCSSTGTKTEVKGVVISQEDPLGGPNTAVAEFRAGERSSYGS
jgi:hypothetical protein